MPATLSDFSLTLLHGVILHYEAEKADALSMLQLYLNDPTGAEDTSELLREIRKHTERAANAEQCIKILTQNFLVVRSTIDTGPVN